MTSQANGFSGWVRKFEGWGEKHSEAKKFKRSERIFGYVIAILVNLLLLFVFNRLLSWHISWLKDSFLSALWIFNVFYGATILFHLFYMVHDSRAFKSFCQFLLNIVSFAAINTLLVIFPFSLDSKSEHFLKTGLVVILICVAIAILVELIRTITYSLRYFLSGE